jgi:hypothetical protein
MDFQNKYKTNIKNRKNLMNIFFYLQIDGDSNYKQFHYCLILNQGPSKFYIIYNGYNLTIFDGYQTVMKLHEI